MSESNVTETIVTSETSSPVESTDAPVMEQPENVPSESPEQMEEQEIKEPVEQGSEKEDEFTKRFAALSKREKQIREERAKIKDLEARVKEHESLKEQGVAKVLESFGFSLDDVINYALGDSAEEVKEPVDPNKQLRDEFEQFKQSLTDKEESAKLEKQKAEEAAIEQAITSHKESIANHLSQNTDKYELINSQNQQDLVWDVTEAHYDNTGEILTVEQAADKVEQYLEGEVRKLLKLKKFGNLTSEQKEQLEEMAPKSESKTLTSNHTVSTPIRESNLSYEESIKKAAELLKWNT